MYSFFKKIIYRFINKQKLIKHELFFRNIYAVLYSGNRHQCNICSKKLSKFITVHKHDLLCPRCGSLARDRRLWKLLNDDFVNSGINVLDFSPSRSLARNMKKIKDIEYVCSDLSGNFIADHQYDITDLDITAEYFDLIICYHILEHIENDKKAMEELYRIMKPGAKGLIQTPFKDGDIYEDSAITSAMDREVHFGQDDHVRIYSVSGLKQRLEDRGFIAEARQFEKDIYNGLLEETVFTITKP
ncbi:class I SAM-dependent methyltransferase [Flavobacterium sp. DGU11]|uniref:Class I SAM-dependent methyltransferase n=1 Tax=Flavobacterium arundinis TaxID=3139143 RepID=A0ABU9HVH1_9FLAO